jgi:hypothetical protein
MKKKKKIKANLDQKFKLSVKSLMTPWRSEISSNRVGSFSLNLHENRILFFLVRHPDLYVQSDVFEVIGNAKPHRFCPTKFFERE